MDRVCERFLERAKTRDPQVQVNLSKLYEKASRENSLGMNILNLIEGNELQDVAKDGTQAIREYMLKESV
jgi:hypothetical protein